jgi:hypothetical protein
VVQRCTQRALQQQQQQRIAARKQTKHNQSTTPVRHVRTRTGSDVA